MTTSLTPNYVELTTSPETANDNVEISPAAAAPKAPPLLHTAEDLLHWVAADAGLKPQIRKNQATAIRALSKITKLPLAAIPLDVTYLNTKVFSLTFAEAGYANKLRWRRIRTDLGAALRAAGVWVVAVRRNNAFTLTWQALLERIADGRLRWRLSAFGRFCSSRGIEPAQVTLETFAQFLEEETTKTAKGKKAYSGYRVTCRTWNWAVANVPGWPQLLVEIPNYANRFSLPKDRFPPSLWADIDAYMTATRRSTSTDNPFRRLDRRAFKVFKPKTLQHHYDLCWEMASAQVREGRDIAEIVDLAALVDPEWVRCGLAFLHDRFGGPTKRLLGFAGTMKTIAEHWVKVDSDTLKLLTAHCDTARPAEPDGFSEKNKKMLLQFEVLENLRALYRLPFEIAAPIMKKMVITEEDAIQVQAALAIELELVTMMRVKNLTQLDIEKSLYKAGLGKNAKYRIVVPGIMVKNEQPLEFPVPWHTRQLWQFFVERCRPLLVTRPTARVFPLEGNPKTRKKRLAYLIKMTVSRRLGLWVTPHQYRHIGVMVYLKQHPDDFETPRLVLGHTSDRTLRKYYAWMESVDAATRFADVVFKDRDAWLAGIGF